MMESSDLPNGHNNQDVDVVVPATKTPVESKPDSETSKNNESEPSTKVEDQISEQISDIDNGSSGNDKTSDNEDGRKIDAVKKEERVGAGQGEGGAATSPKSINEENVKEEESSTNESPDLSAHSDSANNEDVDKPKEDSLLEKSEHNDSLNSESDALTTAESTSVSFPDCHTPNVHSDVTNWASNIRKQLDDIIALKTRRDIESSLSRLRKQLSQWETATANKSCPLIVAGSVKKRKVRFGSSTAVDITPRENNLGDEPDESPPPPKVDFHSLKGLAVFAKWPNSCWHYPGIVEDLEDLNAWKKTVDVTVTFYDGLQRTMKNINILPAALIPVGAILCDLDDETELLVEGMNDAETHLVEFDLKGKPDSEVIKAPFSRLAIRATHMKKIKSLLEPNFDVAPKKMHMVSLDNLVSGRRSRIRSSKDEEDVDVTPRRATRKSKRRTAGEEDDSEAGGDADTDSSLKPDTEASSDEIGPSPSKRRAK